ncbi:MAG: hypothetical protein L3J54_00665 [Draconibacterium sp.]|nr:hypothetical protein [Draconibacterium sp.]
MNTEKTDPKIRENLFSNKTEIVVSAINSIEEKGNKSYIPILFDLLNSDPEKEIAEKISKLLATVKDEKTTASFIDAITDEKYRSIRKLILTTCWQNGLNYSNYLPVFIDIIINDDWENAFEAFTIIDNLELLPEQKTVDKAIMKIESAMESATEQKAYFMNEILTKLT